MGRREGGGGGGGSLYCGLRVNSVVDGVEIIFFTPEILKFSEMIHNKCVFFFLNFCLTLCLSVEKEEVVVGWGGLTIAGSVMVTFVSPGKAAGVLFTSVTFNSQS